ncbi:MAG: Hsp20 family protein [Thaumarchaeota archaeon]|nr:Hsp20 family protein [Nitrososphaerota archaeon]
MSEDKRKNLKDMLDELDMYFGQFEKDIQDAVRNSISISKAQSEPFVAGFSFKLGPEGKPSIQVFGDRPLHNDGFRSPLSEQIVDEKNRLLRIVLDMPGVKKEDIKVDTTDDGVVVEAESGNRKYKANMALKAEIKPESGKAEYKNGVLEILFSLRDKTNKGYRRVDIV